MRASAKYCLLTFLSWSQYVLWGNETDLDLFYSNSKVRSIYKQHLKDVVNRVNSINGASLHFTSILLNFRGGSCKALLTWNWRRPSTFSAPCRRIDTRGRGMIPGIRYKDDAAIFAWNLMNEPRCDCFPSDTNVAVNKLPTGCRSACTDQVTVRSSTRPLLLV